MYTLPCNSSDPSCWSASGIVSISMPPSQTKRVQVIKTYKHTTHNQGRLLRLSTNGVNTRHRWRQYDILVLRRCTEWGKLMWLRCRDQGEAEWMWYHGSLVYMLDAVLPLLQVPAMQQPTTFSIAKTYVVHFKQIVSVSININVVYAAAVLFPFSEIKFLGLGSSSASSMQKMNSQEYSCVKRII